MVLKEIKNMQSDGITSADRENLARQLKLCLHGRLAVVGIDYGGRKSFLATEPYLGGLKVQYNYHGTVLPHFEVENGEYRPVVESMSEIKSLDPADTILLYDDWSTSGVSWIGPLYFILGQLRPEDSKQVFVATDRDSTGGPQFSAVRVHPYIGTIKFLKYRAPTVYEELYKYGRLGSIGEVSPEIANAGYVQINKPLNSRDFHPRRIPDSPRHTNQTLVSMWQ